jgi:hypothetical protein
MIAKAATKMAIANKNSLDFHHYRLHYIGMKNKLPTLKDRLDNALKDDHTALEQLAKTLPLSDTAKKKYDKLSNRKFRQ